MNNEEEAAYANQLISEATTALEQLFEDCPDAQKQRFVSKVREWLYDQPTD